MPPSLKSASTSDGPKCQCNEAAKIILNGYYAMVVNPLIQGYEFSKCLMDGGSSMNIMYVETLMKLGLTKTQLRHSVVTFYGVVPGLQVLVPS
jgi:hypothetical protein